MSAITLAGGVQAKPDPVSLVSPLASYSDKEIADAIVGTWTGTAGLVSIKKTYFSDGTAKGFLLVNGDSYLPVRCDFESRWKVEGGVLICYGVQSSNHDILPADFVATIASSTSKSLRFSSRVSTTAKTLFEFGSRTSQ